MQKYQTILNNMITLRAKEELIKTESFGSLKHDAENFAMHSNFRYITKFRYHSELSLCSENSAYSENFAMIAKISLSLRKFRYHCENFAMPAKIAILLLLASCIFQPALCIFQPAISSSQA